VPREAAEAVEAGEPLGLDERPEGFALGVERGLFAGDSAWRRRRVRGLVEGGGERLDLGAGSGERAFLGFGALQAGELLVFQALGLGLGKVKLVLDGLGLGGVVRESCWAR
jgi:hypothetical protein